MTKELSGSMEDYLESILILKDRGNKVRVTDIAAFLNVSRPSVVNAISHLKKRDLVLQLRYGDVHLTDEGEEKAAEIYAKHVTIRQFLLECLGVDKAIAEQDACRIEHLLHPETIDRMKEFTERSRVR